MWGGPEDGGEESQEEYYAHQAGYDLIGTTDPVTTGNVTLGPGKLYVTKDSGEKAVHSDGVQRDTQVGKTKFTLMFPRGVPMREQLFTRVAELYTRGGEKYGDRNWENSCAPDTLDHHLEALWRHFMSFFFEENQEEDHAAAIMWNVNAVELTRRNIREQQPIAASPPVFTDTPVCIHGDPSCDTTQGCHCHEDADEVPLPSLLAVRDNQGDYWKPNDDGTFNCWPQGSESDDSSCDGWTMQDIQDGGYGPVECIYERPKGGLPWE
jgi:hypothetical protein